MAERQLTINPLSCEEQQRVRGVKWPPSHFARWSAWTDKTLTAAGLFGENWLRSHFFGKWSSCQNKQPLFFTPYPHMHTNTHILLADSTQWHDCICSTKQTSANRPADLIVTQHRGTQTLSRVQSPTDFCTATRKLPMRSANVHRWPRIARKQLEPDVPPDCGG